MEEGDGGQGEVWVRTGGRLSDERKLEIMGGKEEVLATLQDEKRRGEEAV